MLVSTKNSEKKNIFNNNVFKLNIKSADIRSSLVNKHFLHKIISKLNTACSALRYFSKIAKKKVVELEEEEETKMNFSHVKYCIELWGISQIGLSDIWKRIKL